MKTLSFKYTKSNGKQSDRVIVPISSPSKNVFGIDISELSQEEQATFAVQVGEARIKYMDEVNSIMAQFDVSTMYRNFLADKMGDIVEEEI